MKKSILLFLSFWAMYFPASAFNARAAEIGYQCSTGLTYNFYVTVWGENLSPGDTICFSFGDNTSAILTGADAVSTISLASSLPPGFQNMVQVIWNVPHSFPGPGVYNQYLSCINRAAGIANIPNSINTTLILNTQVNVDPNIGCNSAPVNMNGIYMFFPSMSQPNTYNLNYAEPNNDSLSYSFGPCNEPGYTYPHVSGGGTFSMDSVTGQFTWNNPTNQGIYNLMLYITQWRHFGNAVINVGYHEQEIQFVVDAANAVAEVDGGNVLSVFPNPSSTNIAFQLKNNSVAEIIILDQFGREVRRRKLIGEEQIEISTADLSNGMYFYQCVGKDKIIGSGKFIVEH